MKNEEKSIDLTNRKLVAVRDVQDALSAGATSILAAANCVITPSARDLMQQHDIELVTGGAAQTMPVNGRVAVDSRPDLVRSDHNGLFASGTLGRYSKVLNTVVESRPERAEPR